MSIPPISSHHLMGVLVTPTNLGRRFSGPRQGVLLYLYGLSKCNEQSALILFKNTELAMRKFQLMG